MAEAHADRLPGGEPTPPGGAADPGPTGPGPDPAPAWPWWYAIVGLVTAAVFILVVGAFLAGFARLAEGPGRISSPGFTIVATTVQDLILIVTAVVVAATAARPRPWHFGLRRTALRPAAGTAALGFAVFFLFEAFFTLVAHPHAKQSVAQDLGVNRGGTALVLGGLVVIVLAPVAEEFFFRGFFYRAIRNGFARRLAPRGAVIAAALVDGAVFGLIHVKPLILLPVLGVFGFILCLVYERTGTLYATIALHAINNTIAYAGVAKNGAPVAAALGAAMVAACVVVPRLADGRSRAPAPTPT